jgi:hypothetical protein
LSDLDRERLELVRDLDRLFWLSKRHQRLMQNSELQRTLPRSRFFPAHLLAEKAVRGSFSQAKEMQIHDRPSTKNPGLEFWIGKLRCDLERFPKRIVG